MKFWVLFLVTFSCCADTAFYSSVDNLSGYNLKRSLERMLQRSHKKRSYGDLYDVYFKSDLDKTYDNDGSIMDMYSELPNSADPYTFKTKKHRCGNYRLESDCFNREHLFPQGIFDYKYPMKSDFFHIYPTDGVVNNKRGSFPFGEVSSVKWRSKNGSKLGRNKFGSYKGMVFEPIDEFKGDIARAMLYFATRYGSQIPSWDSHPMVNGTKDQVYSSWFIKLLLKWHRQDPVSEHEIFRNNAGQKFQGNRNPFIDHPEWAEQIWSNIK